VGRLRSSRAKHHNTRVGNVCGKDPWSVYFDDALPLGRSGLPDMEECHSLHPVRLALVVGARALERGLVKSPARMGVGWPHLSDEIKDEIIEEETKDETKDTLVDYSQCVNTQPLV